MGWPINSKFGFYDLYECLELTLGHVWHSPNFALFSLENGFIFQTNVLGNMILAYTQAFKQPYYLYVKIMIKKETAWCCFWHVLFGCDASRFSMVIIGKKLWEILNEI